MGTFRFPSNLNGETSHAIDRSRALDESVDGNDRWAPGKDVIVGCAE